MAKDIRAIHVHMIGGNCPVQAEGTIDGEPFYFRARGNAWSIGIGGRCPIVRPDWSCREAYGEDAFAAGWMSEDEARSFIFQAAERYRSNRT